MENSNSSPTPNIGEEEKTSVDHFRCDQSPKSTKEAIVEKLDNCSDHEASCVLKSDNEKRSDEPITAMRAEAEVQRMLSAALSNNQRRLERAYMQMGRKETFNSNASVLCWSAETCKVETNDFEQPHSRNCDTDVANTSPASSIAGDFQPVSVIGHSNLKCSKCNFYGLSIEDVNLHCAKQHTTFQRPSTYQKHGFESYAPTNKTELNEHGFESNEATHDAREITCENASRINKAKMHRCKQCKFFAFTKEEFWAHARTHMKEEKILECPSCSFVTEYKHHLEYHIRNHIGSKPFKCDKCSYECVNKSMLNSHMKSHNNVYQYLCADCCYATKYCHSMKLHVNKYRHRPATILHHPDLAQPSASGDDHAAHLTAPPPPASSLLPPTPAFNAAAAALAAAAMRDEVSLSEAAATCRSLGIHVPPPVSLPPTSMPPSAASMTAHNAASSLANFRCVSSSSASAGSGTSPLWPPSFPSLLTAFTGSPYFSGANVGPGSLIPPPMGSSILAPPPTAPGHQHNSVLKPPLCLSEAIALGGTSIASGIANRGFLMPLVNGSGQPQENGGSGAGPVSKRTAEEAEQSGETDVEENGGGGESESGSPFDAKRAKLEENCEEASPDPESDFPDEVGRGPVGVGSTIDVGASVGAEVDGYMECSHCELLFRDHIMFDIHMGYHGYTNPFACNRCGYTAETKVDFFLHLMQKSH